MLRKPSLFTTFVFYFLACFIASTAFAQTAAVIPAIPVEIDVMHYPTFHEHTMTVAEMAAMGLHPVVITKRVQIHNRSDKTGKYSLDWAEVGELFSANDAGELIYKVNCSNRVAVVKECQKCVTAVTSSAPKVAPLTTGGGDLEELMRRVWHGIPSWMRTLIKSMFGAILIGLLLWAIVAIARAMSNSGPSSTPLTPADPAPAPQPTPRPAQPAGPPPPPFHVGLGYGRRGRNRELWFGPFQTVTISDRQRDGFHVNVDGRDVATFTRDVRLENAGDQGSWVVVAEQN